MIIDISILTDGPISHNEIGADLGNVTLFRRSPRVQNGNILRVPVISAGALRGIVRRLLWRETFDRCGLSRETVPGWDRLYAALANGGTIEAAETRISPDVIRQRRESLPVLSLLGAALYTSHMGGRLRMGHAWLDCSELGTGQLSMHDLVTETSTVRHHDAEEQDPDVSGVGPMPTTVETVILGARFETTAHVSTELEASALAHGLDLVTHLGGKVGQGNGAVRIKHSGDGSRYVAWLEANHAAVRASLLRLCDELQRQGKSKAAKAKDKREAAAPQTADDGEGKLF